MRAPFCTRSVSIDLDDVYAFCRTGDLNGGRRHENRELYVFSSCDFAPRQPGVELYTRLRESERNDPLLHFTLTGRDAIEVWEAAGTLAEAGGDFARCGRWVLRPGRVRMVQYSETSASDAAYTVYMGMTDDRAGGWVAKIQLDLDSGRTLEKTLAESRVTAAPA